jgi:oligopeptide/dipeptide ABC transporter ATP-binding protein
LDVTVQAQIVGCLSSLRRTNGIAILFITHDLGLVHRFADRMLVMYAGEIVESGRVAEVFARPRMPYTAALLASRPRFDDTGRPIPLEPIPGAAVAMGAIPSGCSFHTRCRHADAAVCSEAHPSLELAEDAHQVRCARWRQLA